MSDFPWSCKQFLNCFILYIYFILVDRKLSAVAFFFFLSSPPPHTAFLKRRDENRRGREGQNEFSASIKTFFSRWFSSFRQKTARAFDEWKMSERRLGMLVNFPRKVFGVFEMFEYRQLPREVHGWWWVDMRRRISWNVWKFAVGFMLIATKIFWVVWKFSAGFNLNSRCSEVLIDIARRYWDDWESTAAVALMRGEGFEMFEVAVNTKLTTVGGFWNV